MHFTEKSGASVFSWHTISVFLSEDRKSDTSSAASRFAVDTRMKQAYPFLAVDFYSDITRINEIISGDPLPIHITERMNRLISSV